MNRVATAVSFALLSSARVFAHPGHGRGGGDFSALHYLIEPLHLVFAIPVVAVLALAVGYASGLIRPRKRAG